MRGLFGSRLWGVLFVYGAAGCGHTEQAGPAGNGGASGERPDPATATPFEACVYYLRAQCNRRFYECAGRAPVSEPCPDYDSQCPDFLFSPGSRYEVAGVIACGDRWATASCHDLENVVFPTCGLPAGIRAVGTPCAYGSQCDSRTCATWAPGARAGCGFCAEVVPIGASCEGTKTCATGLECEGGTTCAPLPEFGLEPGAPCERFGQCAGGYRCLTFAGQTQATCQPLPKVGEACPTDNPYCSESFCVSGVCQAGLGQGQSCTQASGCEKSLFCDMSGSADGGMTGTCAPRPRLGQACKVVDRDFLPANCAEGLCHCSDPSCVTAVCVQRLNAGQSCTEPNSLCIPGTSCLNGVCVITGSQGRAVACDSP